VGLEVELDAVDRGVLAGALGVLSLVVTVLLLMSSLVV